jgi:alkanesulfonate monooxygenase SsuD/methylene tetrahydromethanopterin reductase-like flavin-dependent oxidoreductase (luciferase family)
MRYGVVLFSSDRGITPARAAQAAEAAGFDRFSVPEHTHIPVRRQGEFVRFDACWTWPKPVQQPRVPILIGAGGSEKTFAWIARSADGWLTTPGESGLDGKLALLGEAWRAAGREGRPQVAVLSGRPDPDTLSHWADMGVTDVAFGMPDRSEDEVLAYLGRLATRLGVDPVRAR